GREAVRCERARPDDERRRRTHGLPDRRARGATRLGRGVTSGRGTERPEENRGHADRREHEENRPRGATAAPATPPFDALEDRKGCERKPFRKPTSSPSSSATKLVSRKCSKKRRGRSARICRPPHQSSTTGETRSWSEGSAFLIVTATGNDCSRFATPRHRH